MKIKLQSPINGRELTPIQESNDVEAQLVIWGTDVVVSQCKRKFKMFILSFRHLETDIDERHDGIDAGELFYLQKLREV